MSRPLSRKPRMSLSLSSESELHILALRLTSRMDNMQGSPFGACLLAFASHTGTNTAQNRQEEVCEITEHGLFQRGLGSHFIVPEPPTHRHIRSASDVTTINTLTQ